ncbi:uridine kinase [Cellulomonas sp.]|uniref:uridine kinase n=1 Tax=Cellulomonas sp. TaxID=40001 RepID=UPI002587BA36|nr:uridine kinase [Cellulomonas sp.]MCR6688733.1 uridine kinase [Cellulomonas sp.]
MTAPRVRPDTDAGPSGRDQVLEVVAERVGALRGRGRPVRVGVDGADGAGKTTFADALGAHLADRDVPVVRSSVDGFHRPRAQRYRQGPASPRGFFEDSYDYAALRRELLDPLGPHGDRRYRTAVHDVRSDEPVDEPVRIAPDDAVLVVDGIFLHRDELAGVWDLSVFLDVPFAVTYARMAVRDACPPDPADPANRRYLEGQRLYLAACDPAARASLVVDNTDPAHPQVLAGRD